MAILGAPHEPTLGIESSIKSLSELKSDESGAFEAFLQKIGQGDARRARGFLEAKYIAVRGADTETRALYAGVFRKYGREDLARILEVQEHTGEKADIDPEVVLPGREQGGACRESTAVNLDIALETTPHYTNPRFQEERTVYGAAEHGLFYNYSDRLEDNRDKHNQAKEAANKSGATLKSARWYQAYLSVYYGYEVDLKHIVVGINKSNGWYYQVFGTAQRPESVSDKVKKTA